MASSSQKVFISYSHRQGTWVWDCLVPVLRAGGADVLIDRERFVAGRALLGQMDAAQNVAEVHALVLSSDYLTSEACLHEMEHAIACDPYFDKGVVLPIKYDDVELPEALRQYNPLYVDLSKDDSPSAWDLLLRSCGANLGMNAPEWLAARNEIRRFLSRGQSVNLVVKGDVKWRELLVNLQSTDLVDLALVNLESPATVSRRGLAVEILRALGLMSPVPPEPEDLVELDRLLSTRNRSRLAITHFDLAVHRQGYGIDLFAALRYLVMDSRRLVLLVQSRRPFATLMPTDHPLSDIDLKTVEMRGR